MAKKKAKPVRVFMAGPTGAMEIASFMGLTITKPAVEEAFSQAIEAGRVQKGTSLNKKGVRAITRAAVQASFDKKTSAKLVRTIQYN